jgi:hypothetical protein
MSQIGQLRTSKPIEKAIRDLRYWLTKIEINGLSINARYDAKQNIALLNFIYKEKKYEFRSTKQSNCRLNMWAICKAMESKIRNHLMGIEPFEKSMTAYLQLEGPTISEEIMEIDNAPYVILGISSLSSNEELEKHYNKLAKSWHPDMAGSEEAKEIFEQKFAEINQAWTEIKKQRGIK